MSKNKDEILSQKLLSDPSYTIAQIPNTTTAVDDNYLFETQSSSLGQSEKCSALTLLNYIKLNIASGTTLYVSGSIGVDNSSRGSIAAPYATVSYATSQAAPLASASNPYTIVIDGVINEAGSLNLYQYVNILGNPGATINISNILALSDTSSWGTEAGNVTIENVAINATNGVNLNFQTIGSQNNTIQFNNVNFLNSDGVLIYGTGVEFIQFRGIYATIYSAMGIFVEDANATIDHSIVGNVGAYNDSIYSYNTSINLLNSSVATLDIQTTGAQSLTFFSNATPQQSGSNVNIYGVNSFWYADAASYNVQPSFSGGATTDNVVLTSLSDSINVTYSPSHYSPINTSEYGLNSLSAHLAGIDAALTSSSNQAFSAYLTSGQPNVTGDGTIYQLICDAQDTPSTNYNASTGVYTADKDGYYQFSASVNLYNLNSSMTSMKLWLYTTTNTYVIDGNNPFIGMDGSDYTSIGSATVWMNAGDTAYIGVEVDGNSKQVGVYSSSNPIFAFFGGSYLGASGNSGNDVNGLTISIVGGASAASVTSSHGVLNGNIVTLTGRIHFTPSLSTVTLNLGVPFSPTFTASDQADGVFYAVKTSGGASGNATMLYTVSVTSSGNVQVSFSISTTGVDYSGYLSIQYTVNN